MFFFWRFDLNNNKHVVSKLITKLQKYFSMVKCFDGKVDAVVER